MRTSVVILAAVCLCGPGSAALGQAAKPLVHVVATGGTIASTNYYSAQGGKIGVAELLKSVPALDSVARVSAEQFLNVASSQITVKDWLAMSRAIADTLRARRDLAGIVVTHGTDTMEETAYFLDLTIADPRPVVVTGAMRPSDGIGIDGPANLYNAVRVAADSSARGRGAMVLLNDEIFAARDVTKGNTVRPDAFVAPARGALGVADPERIVFHRVAQRAPIFDLSAVQALPRVDIAYAYAGADGAAIDAFAAAGARGIVVAGVGRGGMTGEQRQAVNRAIAKGLVVVIGSRAGAGSVRIGTGVRERTDTPTTIGAGDLTVQKARVLLMLTLTRTNDPREVARVFSAHQ